LPSASSYEPSTVAEAADVMLEAARSGQRLSIDRAGGELVLSTRRLRRVLEYAPGDLTATVEAGLRLDDLNALLLPHGQMLALDPPGNPTIGACLAGSLSGPRRHRYGAPRDLVLGATVVLADGTIASSGGKVVKNVAGYDLAKLFCGSRGRLGLIARASLRLHPRPAAARTLLVPVESAAEANRMWQLLFRSQLVPSAVDLGWRGASSELAVLFEGSERAASAQLESARALLGGKEGSEADWEAARAWQAGTRGRVSFPPRALEQTVATLNDALVRPGPGTAYVTDVVEDDGEAGARALAERVRQVLDPAGMLA
jgi:glycolate oxidase FAD binding subunit